jgi:hypothetical protein
MKPNIDKDFKSPCSKFRRKERTQRWSNSITIDAKTATDAGDRDQDYNSNLQSTVSRLGSHQKHRRLKTAMPRKQSEPTNYAETSGAKSLTIKSRNGVQNRNVSNTDIEVVTAHDDTTLSKGRSENNST